MIVNPDDVNPKLKVLAYFTLQSNSKSWNQRSIPEFQFMLIVNGNFKYIVDDKEYFLSPGDIFCVLPEQLHTFTCVTDPDQEATLCGLRFEPCPGLSYTANDYRFKVPPTPVSRTTDNSDIHDLFYKCVKLFRNNDSKYTNELLSTIIKEIWIRLSEYWENGGEALLSSRIRKVLKYIDNNLLNNISRRDIAKQFGMTPEYLNAIFKKELNTSPVQYINSQRIHRAYHIIISQDCSVKECAEMMGFKNEYYFSKLFKKITGHSPSHIKKGI